MPTAAAEALEPKSCQQGVCVTLVALRRSYVLGSPMGCRLTISNETGEDLVLSLGYPPDLLVLSFTSKDRHVVREKRENWTASSIVPFTRLAAGRQLAMTIYLDHYIQALSPGQMEIPYRLILELGQTPPTNSIVYTGTLRLRLTKPDNKGLEAELHQLSKGLSSPDRQIREAAFFALYDLDSAPAAEYLATAACQMRGFGDDFRRQATIEKIARLPDPQGTRALRSILLCRSEPVIADALSQLAVKGVFLDVRELLPLVQSTESTLRHDVVNYLGQVGAGRYISVLKLLAKDRDADVRRAAQQCLKGFSGPAPSQAH